MTSRAALRVHVLQHVPFEGLGSIEPWLSARGAEVRHTRFFAGDPLPAPDDQDLVIALGGPMSVNDEDALPWLRPEKQFVRETIARGTAMLGVCLGAQLVASALGARVYRNAEKEIGWFPIRSTAAEGKSDGSLFQLPAALTVFHWHGETFDLPAGAMRIAESDGCRNQAFQIGRRALALQFHLETMPGNVRALLEHCAEDLTPGRYVQTADALGAVAADAYRGINATMSRVLEYLIDERRAEQ